MGRAPCCSKVGLHRGPWTPREDALLTRYIQAHGEGQWRSLPKRAGLLRCGKSCRLRWMNYLRPDIKRGNITPEEDDLIIRMHSLLGNRWSLIAGRIPGRTDNEIKNYWNTHLSKKLRDQETSFAKKAGKRKKNGCEKKKYKQKKDKNEGIKVETEKTLVYLPKPIRVTASLSPILRPNSTITLESNSGSASTTQEKEQSQQDAKKVWGLVGNNDEWFHIGLFAEHGDDLVNNCDVECESSDHYGTLEKLYEEYLQLLNTEEKQNPEELHSFAKSLLV